MLQFRPLFEALFRHHQALLTASEAERLVEKLRPLTVEQASPHASVM